MKCENCNKEHDGSYGSGRFCSKHCRCSYIAKQVKNRKSGFTMNALKNRAPYGTWKCKICNIIFNTRKLLEKHNHEFHPIQSKTVWNKGLTKETDIRIKDQSEKISIILKNGIKSGYIKKRKWTQNDRLKASEQAKKKKLGGYHRNGGKGKRGWYKGIWCDSSWELALIIYWFDHNIQFSRCKERFTYLFENSIHTYNPDFILSDGSYVEVKGWKDSKWQAKINQFPKNKKIIVIDKNDIQPYLQYVILTYGKDFIYLYDKK